MDMSSLAQLNRAQQALQMLKIPTISTKDKFFMRKKMKDNQAMRVSYDNVYGLKSSSPMAQDITSLENKWRFSTSASMTQFDRLTKSL